ncbi:hypothetical protein JCM10212_000288 [Sporobolomyces blumeae]
MSTVAAISIPSAASRPRAPLVSTFDPSFSPGSLHLAPTPSRWALVTSGLYVRQPTRAQLKENNGVFGSPNRPYYYKDPEGKPFIDIDGKICGERWIYVEPLGGEATKDRTASPTHAFAHYL